MCKKNMIFQLGWIHTCIWKTAKWVRHNNKRERKENMHMFQGESSNQLLSHSSAMFSNRQLGTNKPSFAQSPSTLKPRSQQIAMFPVPLFQVFPNKRQQHLQTFSLSLSISLFHTHSFSLFRTHSLSHSHTLFSLSINTGDLLHVLLHLLTVA